MLKGYDEGSGGELSITGLSNLANPMLKAADAHQPVIIGLSVGLGLAVLLLIVCIVLIVSKAGARTTTGA